MVDEDNKPRSSNPEFQRLHECITHALSQYFSQLGEQKASNIYDMVLTEIEAPALKEILRFTNHNQSKAAEILGVSRGTLRKKLKTHDLL